MALRRGIILALVTVGGMSTIYGTPQPYQPVTFGAFAFLLAYIYARLTDVRRPL